MLNKKEVEGIMGNVMGVMGAVEKLREAIEASYVGDGMRQGFTINDGIILSVKFWVIDGKVEACVK